MDWFPMLFDALLVVLVITLVIWAFDDKLVAWRRRFARKIRRQRAVIRCTDGKVVGGITPTMSAEEVIAICNSIPF